MQANFFTVTALVANFSCLESLLSQGVSHCMPLFDNVIQNLQNLAWSATLVGLFAIFELRRSDRPAAMKGRLLNFFLGTLVAIFGFALSVLFYRLQHLVPQHGLLGYLFPNRPSGLVGLVVSILIYGGVWDFFQYWFHRLQHEQPALWPIHRVHHSDASINASTALRRSIPELALIFLFVFIPTVFTAGIDPAAAWFAFVIFYSWGFFNHADLRISLGFMTPVFSGPAWHRLHHALDAPDHNCNYAAFFPVLDIIFGTYRAPREGVVPATGLADEVASAQPVLDCLLPRRR
jgi:sterol desaturase/sphingolipid hydroxylase (fatty acid hydroxylase superfamily)